MLFDLRGRRRRAVQATYLLLAVLMGGGLVLFGIGGEVSGALRRLRRPRRGGRWSQRRHRGAHRPQRGASRGAAGQRGRPQGAGPRLLPARRVPVRVRPGRPRSRTRPGTSCGGRAPTGSATDRGGESPRRLVGDPGAPAVRPASARQPEGRQRAAEIVAASANDAQAYLAVVQYATLAGDTRTADLATQKAITLAPRASRKEDERQTAKQLKKTSTQHPPSG